MGDHAWVTLATNDSYSLGALVLAHSLKQVGTQQQLAVLITPGVTGSMRAKLSEVFNVVVEVNLLDSKDETNLRLLKRPELGVTFTKLHCWRLTQFDKCVFLDADTLVLENCDELFDREELSAAPDIGWPDCFNSGVFVFRPSMETYEKLIQFAIEKGSFDGGDQGLLNLYFSDWAHKDISKHLPFIYNMASTACYSYLPAFKQFGRSAKIIHFIGASKPWLQYFDTESRQVHPSEGVKHLQEILQLWWNIFCNLIHPSLSPEMAGLAGAFAKLTLGSPRTAEQRALDDHLRRQGWEVGHIDYLGKDSFDNIWNKICLTLSSVPEQTTAIKEPSPTAESKPVKDMPVEVKCDEQQQSMEVASSGDQAIQQVREAKPVETLTASVTQEPVAQPIGTPGAETVKPLACDQITVTAKIEQVEAKKIGELKTDAIATEVTPTPVSELTGVPQQMPKEASVQQVEVPASVVETPETLVTKEPATQPIETSVAETLSCDQITVTERIEQVEAEKIAEIVELKTEAKTTESTPTAVDVPQPLPEQVELPTPVTETPVPKEPVPTPTLETKKEPEVTPVQIQQVQTVAPVVETLVPTPTLESQPAMETSAPVTPASPVPETAQPSPLLTSKLDSTSATKSPTQPTTEELHKPTSEVEKVSGESPTPVSEISQPEQPAPPQPVESPKPLSEPRTPSEELPKQPLEQTAKAPKTVCPKKPAKEVEKLVEPVVPETEKTPATPEVPIEPAEKMQTQVTAPTPPIVPDSKQPELKVAKEALKVEMTAPATPPPDAQQTSSGPTPPPRKSSGGTKKTTKPKK